jgi:hypothetical protein
MTIQPTTSVPLVATLDSAQTGRTPQTLSRPTEEELKDYSATSLSPLCFRSVLDLTHDGGRTDTLQPEKGKV